MSKPSVERKGRFVAYTQNPHIPKAMRALEPRLGRSFMRGEERRHTAVAEETIKARLISELGARGYGRLLEQLRAITVEEPAPKPRPKRRRRRAPAKRRALVNG